MERAMNAYLRISEIGAPLPFSSDSGVVMEGTRRLVVLRKGGRILAVYQIAGGGTLKHLEREDYPRSLESRARACVRLLKFGFYDESLSLTRSIGEIANLLCLFTIDKAEPEKWRTMSIVIEH